MSQNSASILADKGRLLWVSGRREDGLRLLRQLEQADADAVSPHRYLKFAYFGMGEYAGYLSEMKKEGQLLHDASTPSIEEAAEKGFAAHGARGMLEGELEQEKKAYNQGKLSPYWLAETYSRLGNTQEALKYVEACYDRHADETVNIAADPAFNNLHSVPAFQTLLSKVGLPPIH